MLIGPARIIINEGARGGFVQEEAMDADAPTVTNPVTGETITFLETSEESGGARVVVTTRLAPGGAVVPIPIEWLSVSGVSMGAS